MMDNCEKDDDNFNQNDGQFGDKYGRNANFFYFCI